MIGVAWNPSVWHDLQMKTTTPVSNHVVSNVFKATEEKVIAIKQADKTAAKAMLAERLILNLAGENDRWTKAIENLRIAEGWYPALSRHDLTIWCKW